MNVRIEVVYALPDHQALVAVTVPAGTTVLEAVRLSGILERFSRQPPDLAKTAMGVFGKAIPDPASRVVEEGDRVEIYRPLEIDPKAARRARAQRRPGR